MSMCTEEDDHPSVIGVRNKARLSTFERKQLKKKQRSNSDLEPPSSSVSTTISLIESSPLQILIEDDSKLLSFEPELARQLSAASNHVAKRCVLSLKEEGNRVQK